MPVSKKPVVLTILDGWGYRPQIENNAIALARKPVYDKLLEEYPNTLPVSYTHLDVYKRQALWRWARGAIRDFEREISRRPCAPRRSFWRSC